MLGKKTGIVKKPGFSLLFSRRGVNRQKRNTLAPDRGPIFNGLAQKLLTVLKPRRTTVVKQETVFQYCFSRPSGMICISEPLGKTTCNNCVTWMFKT